MSTSARIGLVIVIIVAIVAGIAVINNKNSVPPVVQNQGAATTTQTTADTTFDKTISDGTITAGYDSSRWGLATNKEQILVTSYIPACDETFSYCLYYSGKEYAGTNFESAGLRIAKRADLSNERLCLQTPPEGFSASVKPTATHSANEYASSVFSNVGDAGAGHTASGSLYRLFVRSTSTCYDFQTRIGQTQFANYPAGTIKEFTPANKAAIEAELQKILNDISLPSGAKNLFS
jgi:hypothetical protein